MSAPRRTGVLLAGHGTRSEQGQAEVRETARLVAQRLPQAKVAVGFLELAEPTLDDAIAALVAEGCERVIVAPLLLFAAGHAKQDLPRVLARAAARHPSTEFYLAGHLGCHEKLLALSAARYRAALPAGMNNEESVWLMVGRGSLDPTATAEMHRFVEMRRRLTPVAEARVAFLAMAQPRLETALAEIAAMGVRRVVVQPHLLFHGDLLTQLTADVAAMAAKCPDTQWLVTSHLGPAQEVADAIVDRAEAAFRGWESRAASVS